MIQLSVQIALPGRIPLGPGEGGASGEGAQETVWVLDVVGHTVDDAMMNLQQQISGKLFLDISASLSCLKNLPERNGEFKRLSSPKRGSSTYGLVDGIQGKAKELMEAAPKLERVPALYLSSTLDDAVKHGKFPSDYIGTFWNNSSKKGQEGFLPYIQIMKERTSKLAAWLFQRRQIGRRDETV